jgi:hypothetical protein
MKIYVYGTNKDDKGKQLEILTASFLESLGYTTTRNVIGSGGNEIDVVASKKECIGGDSKMICECKAHNSLITINDWLKFIGKIYLAHRKDTRTQGLMIALSGANGNVIGSYEEIKEDNYITLITNEDIYGYIEKIHPMFTKSQLVGVINQYARKDIMDINIIYYDKGYYWLIFFAKGEYTILKDDLANIEDWLLKPFKKMVESQTEARLYIDIKEANAAKNRCSLIRSLILSYILDTPHNIQEILDWINLTKQDLKVTKIEIDEALSKIPFLESLDNGMVKVKVSEKFNPIEFYRSILQDTISKKILTTKFYKGHIDRSLLNEILKIQCNIQIPTTYINECLFILKYSPSALSYAIYPDKDLTRYRNSQNAIYPNLEKAHTEWFLDNLMRKFIIDYNSGVLNEYYLDVEKITSIEISTKLKIIKEGEKPIEIYHHKNEILAHLGPEYNNKAVLLIKIPKE